MCGIAAIFSYRAGPPVDESQLLRIRDRMTSRGPDGAGIWLSEDRRVGLAHRRLAIIDLSQSAAQPMFNDTGMLAIVFNGEIYNYRELRTELEKTGFRFKSSSDTEVLLHLYEDRGVKMLDRLRGMYAFANFPCGFSSQSSPCRRSDRYDAQPSGSRRFFPVGTCTRSPHHLPRCSRSSSGELSLGATR